MTTHQSKTGKLIAGLCPNGVEFKELGEVCDIKNGYTPSKAKLEYWTNGTIPWFRMEDIRKNGRNLIDSIQHISSGAVKRGGLFPANSIIMATTATIGEHALISVKSLANQQFTYLSIKPKFVEKIDHKFLFYYCFVLAEWCKNNVNSASFSIVDMGGFKKFKIPLPPLAVQEEIVKILNSFTELGAELEAELEARKKQYEYYREELLTSVEGARSVELNDIANYSKTRIAANELDVECYVGVDNLLQNKQGKTASNYVPKTGKLTRYEIGDILIGNIRPYLKKIWKATNIGGTSGDVLVIRINEMEKSNLSSEFLYHLLASDSFFNYNMQTAKGAKMPRGNKTEIMKYKIPIPPIAEQERIVKILDKFDALVNDISIGLPAELSARRQQYEYYRGKLLNLKEMI